MSTITSLPTASTIDPALDYMPIDTASISTTQKINRNTLLGISSTPVGISDTQTLTNKTLTSPTISGPTLSGTITGTYTIGGTPTFPSSVVTLTGIQTLTNKTLTSPTINSPTISNATISADTITGYTTSNAGTIYGVGVSGGQISSGSYLANGIVSSTQIATNGVAASNLATSAITLGYAQITSNFTTTSTSYVQVTGLSASVTIPSGGRRIKITVFSETISLSAGPDGVQLSLWDGTVGSGTQISQQTYTIAGTNYNLPVLMMASVTPSAGSKTYNVGMLVQTGTGSLGAASTAPAFILVEAI